MKINSTLRVLITVSLFALAPVLLYAQPTNDHCAGATLLTQTSACTNTTYNIKNATAASAAVPVAPAGGCGAPAPTTTNTYDMWFTFQATSTTASITISNPGNNLTLASTYIQVFSGTCATLTSLACQAASTRLTVSGLTIGTFYYFRVYVLTNPNGAGSASKYDYDMCLQGTPANDNCIGAVSLTSATTCSTITTTMDLASATGGLPAGCESGGTHYDVWYSFVAAASFESITISNLGANITNPEIQLYSGTCATLTSLQCGTTSITASGLTTGATYYVRVSNVGSNPSGTGGVASFDICVVHVTPPANDNCAGAVTLTPGTNCSNTTGTVNGASVTTGLPAGCESVGSHYVVWYKFTAGNTYEVITASNLGTNFTNPEMQLYSGTCGTLTSLSCGTTSITATGLTTGATYFVRVSNVGSPITTNGGFSICVYHPTGASFDVGKSYVNITRKSGGGTINPGDTLEIRATLVVRSLTLDSLAFIDTLHLGGGVALVPGTIALRTNEGKVYRRDSGVKAPFTDAFDGDAGYYYTSGTDTVIRINIGIGATNVARGRLSNTSRPSVFGSTCIIMATYRVVVYGAYNSSLNLGGGVITMKDATTGISSNLTFSTRNAIVYNSPGLCPNAVSATNAIGGDFNGTFGNPTGAAPLAKNRGSSSNVPGYIYANFATGAPQDYYYGITNNTSGSGTSFTTTTTWPKPDNTSPTHRVFNVWDIMGDHTGATNTAKGNPPCDTTKAYNAVTNPCGYMLVINSAYKTDTAFQYSVSNLCPNTYYEISAWVKNICYKCSCDSNGVGASGAGYIPFAPNDSSGVQPNLAFDINGVDYFTTGNIPYAGVFPATQTGSDSTNVWVKRGFTYLTGASQTSLTLTIRNNAPGGGGNDWALDDISLATCLPNMQYSPSLTPNVCRYNPLTINDTVRSYFNNYVYYKWQRSTDNGATWSDVTGALGPSVPTWNGSSWQYITSYTIPPANTDTSDSGDRYRLIVATTAANLSTSSCQFTDGVSIINLSVTDCGVVLKTDLLSFNGTLINDKGALSWTTSKESEPLSFTVERSTDGSNFIAVGTVASHTDYTAATNTYSFIDPAPVTGKVFYRLVMTDQQRGEKYSRTIQLGGLNSNVFTLTNVINPFTYSIEFDISSPEDATIEAELVDLFGKIVKRNSYSIHAGINALNMPNTENLPVGTYIFRVRNSEILINRKVLKKGY